MAKRTVDFTGIGNGNFELLPKGKYNVQVVDVTAKTSSNGNDMDNVKMKVIEGEHAGRYIFSNLVWTEKALFRVRQYLEACGVEVPEGAMDVDMEETIGCELTVDIGHRDYKDKNGDDKTSEDVKKFLPLEESNGIDLDDDEDDLPI